MPRSESTILPCKVSQVLHAGPCMPLATDASTWAMEDCIICATLQCMSAAHSQSWVCFCTTMHLQHDYQQAGTGTPPRFVWPAGHEMHHAPLDCPGWDLEDLHLLCIGNNKLTDSGSASAMPAALQLTTQLRGTPNIGLCQLDTLRHSRTPARFAALQARGSLGSAPMQSELSKCLQESQMAQ